MTVLLKQLTLFVLLAPFVASLIAGLPGRKISPCLAHAVTITGMLISFACSLWLLKLIVLGAHAPVDIHIYTWAATGSFQFNIGFLLDNLTAVMMAIVTFVSLCVHVYSIGYMKGDPADSRFFCFVSLFTFAMLLLVTANNFLQLFIGWEGVGLVSYLLIGFWFEKQSAVDGSLKAFIVNRVGDFGFILGIAAVLDYFGTVQYHDVFLKAASFAHVHMSIIPGHPVLLLPVICILLFIGAMGKSAQVPLHIWLPESMEGPTPISALIHAATMVTAGVYMVARLSPLFAHSEVALSMVLVIGATTAFFLGCVALVQTDIKRVVAYSTISQLGYMMAANGASAFPAGIFHLLTHACFKALLFLAAGSVIIAMHHEQDMRKMGGLWKKLPVTYITFLIGACALSAIPPFAGFYSKDAIIEAVHFSTIPGSTYAYWCLLCGGFITAAYIFRAFFLTFHTQSRVDKQLQIKEPGWVVKGPLIALAIPSCVLGAFLIHSILYAKTGLLSDSVVINPAYNVLGAMGHHFKGVWYTTWHSLLTLPFWFAIAGVFAAWLCCVKMPSLSDRLATMCRPIYAVLVNKYGFDRFNDWVFVRGLHAVARFLFQKTDAGLIDRIIIGGTGRSFERLSGFVRRLQTGYLAHYVLFMVFGLVILLCWMILGR